MQVCRGAYIPYFKIIAPIFCCFIFLERLNPQFRINKMANKHTVNYHPSPSEFTSKNLFLPLTFLWTPKGSIPPEFLLDFFSNLYIPPWLQKGFKFMVLRLLENTFESKESVYSCSQAKLSPRFLSELLQTEEIYLFPPKQSVLKIYFSTAESGRTIELKILPKLNFQGYWSQVLINSAVCNLYIFCFCFVVL